MAYVVVDATIIEVDKSAGDQDKLSHTEILHRAPSQNFFSGSALTVRLRHSCLRLADKSRSPPLGLISEPHQANYLNIDNLEESTRRLSTIVTV